MIIFLARSVDPCSSAAFAHVSESVGSSVKTTKGMVKKKEMMFITP